MLKKWYIISFVVVLSMLGFVSQEQVRIPNQEIILQFNTIQIASKEGQSTIDNLKKHLKEIGVDNITLSESKKGTLKITYYSSVDVALIKNLFSEDENFTLSLSSHNNGEPSTKFPFEENNAVSCYLDIYEIQKEYKENNGLNGVLLVELDSKSDRFFDPNTLFFSIFISPQIENKAVKVAYLIYSKDNPALDNTSKSKPEVRAGPIC